jgi:hypothetical protein
VELSRILAYRKNKNKRNDQKNEVKKEFNEDEQIRKQQGKGSVATRHVTSRTNRKNQGFRNKKKQR